MMNVTATLLSFLGFIILIVGLILFLAGFGVFTIKQWVEVNAGKRAWLTGLLLIVFGGILLIPEIRTSPATPVTITVIATDTPIPPADTPVPPADTPVPPTALNNTLCSGNDWKNCWTLDDIARTATWFGIQNENADIGLGGDVLSKIRDGYTAVFTIEDDMKINICIGEINESFVSGECPIVKELPAGTYRVSNSMGEAGGFRVTVDGRR